MGVSPQHVTLVADTVSTITLDRDYAQIEITNLTGSAEVYITVDGTTEPTVNGDGCQVLAAAIGYIVLRPRTLGHTSGATVVKLKSSGTPKVSVRGL